MTTPVAVRTLTPNIHVRRMDFDFNDNIPKYWFKNNPHLTMFVTAFSAAFPEGEMGFVRSVRAFQKNISNPKLLAEVRAFIGQEAHHGKEHQALNELMMRKGVNANAISDNVKNMLIAYEKTASPERYLAQTCAAEHITALFAEIILRDTTRLDDLDPALRPLLLWHAVEECEHKSVAFDVYQDQVDDYGIPIREMILMTLKMAIGTTKDTIDLLRADGTLTNFASLKTAFSYMYGKQGLMRGMLPKYLSYFRRDFHPTDHNTDQLLADGLVLLKQYVGDKVRGAA